MSETHRIVVVCPSCNRHTVEISQQPVQQGFAVERECRRCQDFNESIVAGPEGNEDRKRSYVP